MKKKELNYTTGKRKSAVARLRMFEGKGKITVNNKDYKEYFNSELINSKVSIPFNITETSNKYDVIVNVKGGGVTGQIEAIQLAITKSLIKINSEYKPLLKNLGLTTRDPRVVERKKYGKKKARKKFQFSKR